MLRPCPLIVPVPRDSPGNNIRGADRRSQSSSCAIGKRTLGILTPADLDELLDVGNFRRHVGGGRTWGVSESSSVGLRRCNKFGCGGSKFACAHGLPGG
jgi:hypothetical protein